jgi:4'-phosphopantetheinyl transferase
MMDVYWLEQSFACVPAADDWLSSGEADRLRGMRFPKRRADWRLGRWTAKHAVSIYLKLPADTLSLARIEIRPEPGGAPEVILGDEPAPVRISISHRDGRAACAIAGPGTALGCDLEIVEPRSPAFAADYFTDVEREFMAQAPPADRMRLLALLWSGKESVLKALRVGLRIDTRSVTVDPIGALLQTGGESWRPLQAHCEGQDFHGWWKQTDGLLRTMVSAPPPASPLTLPSPESPTIVREALPPSQLSEMSHR